MTWLKIGGQDRSPNIDRQVTDFSFAPSQWEAALLCNDVSHWLGASLESALGNMPYSLPT